MMNIDTIVTFLNLVDTLSKHAAVLRKMIAEGRDPTPEEWYALDQQILSARARLVQAAENQDTRELKARAEAREKAG